MITTTTFEKRISGDRKAHADSPVVYHEGKNLRLLTLDRIVLELSAHLVLAGVQKLTSPSVDERAYLLLDWDQMEKTFDDFVRYNRKLIIHGTAVTLLGKTLPVTDAGDGCALISISFPGNRRLRLVDHSEENSFFSALREVVEINGGALRVLEGQRGVFLNIYLPVVRGEDEHRSHNEGTTRDR
jgi:hypothetical protein